MIKVNFMLGISSKGDLDTLKDCFNKHKDLFKKTEIVIAHGGKLYKDLKDLKEQQIISTQGDNYNSLMNYATTQLYSHALIVRDDIFIGYDEKYAKQIIDKNQHLDLMLPDDGFYMAIISVFAYNNFGQMNSHFIDLNSHLIDYVEKIYSYDGYVKRKLEITPLEFKEQMDYENK